jgi:hypothetical protein
MPVFQPLFPLLITLGWPVEEQTTPSTQELVTRGLQKLAGAN